MEVEEIQWIKRLKRDDFTRNPPLNDHLSPPIGRWTLDSVKGARNQHNRRLMDLGHANQVGSRNDTLSAQHLPEAINTLATT